MSTVTLSKPEILARLLEIHTARLTLAHEEADLWARLQKSKGNTARPIELTFGKNIITWGNLNRKTVEKLETYKHLPGGAHFIRDVYMKFIEQHLDNLKDVAWAWHRATQRYDMREYEEWLRSSLGYSEYQKMLGISLAIAPAVIFGND